MDNSFIRRNVAKYARRLNLNSGLMHSAFYRSFQFTFSGFKFCQDCEVKVEAPSDAVGKCRSKEVRKSSSVIFVMGLCLVRFWVSWLRSDQNSKSLHCDHRVSQA